MTCVNAIRRAFIYSLCGIVFSIIVLIAIESFFQPDDPGGIIFENPILNWFIENEMMIVIASCIIAAIGGFFLVFKKKNDSPPT